MPTRCTRPISTALALVLTWGPTTVVGQSAKTATLSARVVDDSTGEAINGAHVVVGGIGRGAYTDSSGALRVERITPGRRMLSFGMLGYRTEMVVVDFERGAQVEADVRLTPDAIPLAGIEVTARGRDRYLARVGVYDRVRTGGKAYFGAEFEERARRVSALHQLFWRIPGLQVSPNRYGDGYVLGSSRGRVSLTLTCVPDVFLDGLETRYFTLSDHPDIDRLVPPSNVAAIEVYAGPAEAPMEFGSTNSCGLVLIWTKRGR